MDALARFNVQKRYDLPDGQNENFQFSEIGRYSGVQVIEKPPSPLKKLYLPCADAILDFETAKGVGIS